MGVQIEYKGFTVSVSNNPDQYRGGVVWTICRNDEELNDGLAADVGAATTEATNAIDQILEGQPEMKPLITHAQYMANSSALHHDYYAQFITPETRTFILQQIGIKKLLKSNDPYFNDIIKHSNGGSGGWVWDHAPLNYALMREAGAVSAGYRPSMSCHTCVGKACARILLAEHKAAQKEGS